jgi:hypothetical protein
MEAGLARLARQPGKRDFAVYLFERGEISLTGMDIFPYKHKQVG